MAIEIVPAEQWFAFPVYSGWSWFRPAYELQVPPIGPRPPAVPQPISQPASLMCLAGQGATGTAIQLNNLLESVTNVPGAIFTSGNPIFVATVASYQAIEAFDMPQPVTLVAQLSQTAEEAYSDSGWAGVGDNPTAPGSITSYSVSVMVNGYNATGTAVNGQPFQWWCVNSIAYPFVIH